MKQIKISLTLVACAVLAGCAQTRSISHSTYREDDSVFFAPRPNNSDPGFEYSGELSEFDVLGITRGAVASDSEIERTLAGAKRVRLNSGSSILLVQSGALFPDGPMVTELSKHFRVVPFSGVPATRESLKPGQYETLNAESFSRSLRLAAARGANDIILCYWGIFESQNEKLATKTVSWVPVVSWMVPDEREHIRIRLKMALVDVRTGDWAMLSPEPIDASKISVSPRRGVVDQKLVESLKQQAYVAGARELMRRCSEASIAN